MVFKFQVAVEAVPMVGVVWISSGLYSGRSTGMICGGAGVVCLGSDRGVCAGCWCMGARRVKRGGWEVCASS